MATPGAGDPERGALRTDTGRTTAASPAAGSGWLLAFGFNQFGELGSATNSGTMRANPAPSPVTLPGGVEPVTQLAAGFEHSLVVTATGQLYAFGNNFFGELGTTANTNMANPTPAPVALPGEVGPVTEVAAGGGHSLALTASGQLCAFGSNLFGELGNPA